MTNSRPLLALIALLVFGAGRTSYAQTASVTEGASLAETLAQLTQVIGFGQLGDFLRVDAMVEIATTPLGASSGGVATKLDPTTGNQVPVVRTMGPQFAERAITAGSGKAAVSVDFIAATYDRLGDLKLDQMQLTTTAAGRGELQQAGIMSLVLSSQTTVIKGVLGATDRFDVGAVVPIVRVKLEGISWVQNAVVRAQSDGTIGNDILRRAEGAGTSTGLGDIAVNGKFRLMRFGAPPPPDAPVEPDPGGLALLGTVRLPTGSRDNLRGLGITRVMAGFAASFSKKRFQPHFNVGFEWWEKGIDITSRHDPTVTLRHQIQYAAGFEYAAAPKLTFLLTVLGRHIRGGGEIEFNTVTGAQRPDLAAQGFTSLDYARPTDRGIRKITIVPGMKWNLKGKFLLSLSGLTTLSDNGLHDQFTPVVGLNVNF